jgi:hypothetical protein
MADTAPISLENEAWIRLSRKTQEEASRRRKILQRKIDPTADGFDPHISYEQLAEDAGESVTNVWRWHKQWKYGISDGHGTLLVPPRCPAALAPKAPGPPKGRRSIAEAQEQEILDLTAEIIRTSANLKRALPVKHVCEVLLAKHEITGEKVPTFAQVRAVIRRIPYQDRLAWAGGLEALKKGGGLPRLVVIPPEWGNVRWFGDQWIFDAFARYDDGEIGRPVLFSLVDCFGGGFVLGFAIHRRFTGHTVAEAVIDAIGRHGKPAALFLDLGRENRAKYIRSGCQALGIELVHTTPHDPAVKGLQEQTHNAFRRFCQRLPWYAPSDILTKPVRDDEPLPFATFCERFTAFVFGEYNLAPYTGLHAQGKKSRQELRAAAAFTPIIPAQDELRVLFANAKLVTVQSQGIKLHGLIYAAPELGRFIGQKVWARQGRTDIEVLVHDEKMEWICAATNPLAEKGGLDDEGRRQFTTDRRALAKALNTQSDERISRSRSRPDWLLLKAQKNLAELGDVPPRPGVRQITPVTGQTPEAAQAVGGRRLKLFRHQP